MMMQRLTLSIATAIVATTNVLLPLVYRRDRAYSHAYTHHTETTRAIADMAAAERLDRDAKTDEERERARDVLLKATDQLDDHRKHAAEAASAAKAAIFELKKLTHASKEHAAIRLSPRRECRAATRFIEREKRQNKPFMQGMVPPRVSMRTSSGA